MTSGLHLLQLSSESELKGHEDSVMYLRWHPVSPDRIASISGQEQNLRFWDARASRNTATLSTPGNNLYLAWSGDGNYVALGNRNDGMLFWRLDGPSYSHTCTYLYTRWNQSLTTYI